MTHRDNIVATLELTKSQHAELAPVVDSLLQLYKALVSQLAGLDLSFVQSYPPGHYYTPLPSMEEVARVAPRVWKQTPQGLPGIDLRVREQQKLFAKLLKYYGQMPFTSSKKEGFRYYFDNVNFCHADAIVLYCMLREFRPRRIIEVGSGFSSCVMLDTNQYYLDSSVQFTFIEPDPVRLLPNMTPSDTDSVQLLTALVQDVDLQVFGQLQENDILFLDCSHVGKIGSDVLHLLFEVLPRLAKGVIVHFHDMFYPFEYPRNWVEKDKRAWNEDYFVRAFLQYNNTFEIMYFNNYLGKMHKEMLEKHMPLALQDIGGSLWLRKVV